MAEQHLCQRHGRPAVASRIRLRPDGTQEVEYLCEIDLAEERMSRQARGQPKPLRRVLLRLLRPTLPAARRRPQTAGATCRERRRHAVLQRRDARAASAGGADGARVGQPRPRHATTCSTAALQDNVVRARPRPGRRRSRRDRGAGRGGGGEGRADGRRALARARTRRLPCSPRTRSRASSARRTSGPSTCCSRWRATTESAAGELLQRFGISHTKLRGAVIRGVERPATPREAVSRRRRSTSTAAT